MRLREIGLIVSLVAGLALPAAAQTTQTTPQKSTNITTPATPPAAKTPAPASSATPATGLLDINTASAADLDALPHIGKTRADKIIKNRPYKGKDELVSKHVLSKSIYNGIKDKIIAKQS